MSSFASRSIYKIVLILTAFALMIPAPVFAKPIEAAQLEAPSATYTVANTNDSGSGSLRQAILDANANSGADTISFAIGTVGSQQTITLTAALPDITDPVVIDGWSQGGAGYTGAPLIELNGASAGNVSGLTLSGSGASIVRGLTINRFGGSGIAIFSPSNKIQGNYIGTDVSGSSDQGNAGAGVLIYSGASNIIGTDGDGVNDAAERNVISGNDNYGINLNGGDSNVVAGNLIGLDVVGTAAIGNNDAGIVIFTNNNRIGTDANGTSDALERNIVSGQIAGANNQGVGIEIVGGATGNVVAGNTVGLNATGTAAVSNQSEGVWVTGNNNQIGTNGDGVRDAIEGNVISGNSNGLRFFSSSGNVAAGNFIGTDVSGVTAIPNHARGVYLDGGSGNRIGTNGDGIGDPEERNIVSGNAAENILFVGGGNHIVAGNYVGLNVNGDPLVNGNTGIAIGNGSSNNRIGTDGSNDIYNSSERNVIAASNGSGVQISSNSNGNIVAGNLIGGSPTSTMVITYPTIVLGLSPQIPSVPVNLPVAITGTVYPGDRTWDKPTFASSYWTTHYPANTTSNSVCWASSSSSGTWFYVDLGAPTPIHKIITNLSVDNAYTHNPHQYFVTSNDLSTWQIVIDEISTSNDRSLRTLILPTDVTARYLGMYAVNWSGGWGDICRFMVFGPEATGAGNASEGIQIFQSSGNRIGTNADGVADTEEANVIGGNGFTYFGGGVSISEGNNNTVAGNFIGTDPSNTLDLGNNSNGIMLHGGTGNTIGGNAAAAGNIIRNSKNTYANGIQLYGYNAQTTGNTVISNTISNNPLHGIDNFATETYPGSTAPGDGPADNTIISNTITNNGGYGIHDYGSSPEIRGNVIQYNHDSGIYNEVNFGNSADPATAGDDYLSRPYIISNTILGNCQKEVGCGGGIISVDTAPSNASTLEADNTPAFNIGAFIAQYWYGVAEVIQNGNPIASAVALDDNAGVPYSLAVNTGPCTNLNNTLIHGDQSNLNCADATTWTRFTDYTVDESGVRTNFMPITSTSPAVAVYSYDANAVTNPTDTGAGFIGEGITTGPFSRYQIMQVTIADQPIAGLTAINDSPTVLGNATNFTATVTGGNNIVYGWDFGDGNTGTGQYPAHTYGALGYYTVLVTATNNVNTMTATTPVTITELPILNLVASNDSPIILGNTTNFTATVTSGNNIVYSWAFGDGNTGTGQYPAHTYGALGYYTALVTATNSVSTMTATTPVTITELPILNLVAINDSPTMLGRSTGFTATVGGFTPITYTWNFGDGSAEVAASSNITTYAYSAAGFYTAIVTATDGTINNTISATTPVTITAPCTSGLVVENTNDSGCGSLRYAVSIATPGDTVIFTPTLASQTITLTTGQIVIDKSITIDGATAPGVTVSGNDNDRVFDIYVENDVTLNALIIVHGWVGEGTGAGINNAGTLTVRNSTIAYNYGMYGGGIYNGGTLTLLNSTLSFNTGLEGSGFYNDGVATVLDNTFTQNQASRSGGGVYNSFNAVMTMANSTLSANSVTDVQMGRGGGLHNSGSLTVTNSTFYTNTSPASNSGGGLFNNEGASLSLANTVIAHSAGGDCLSWSTISSNINNLIEDASCSAALSGDPRLGPLANNGGPTLTHLPQAGSPVIDAGDNASAAGLTYDQRGPGFLRIVNGIVDIGAVEVAVASPILTAINNSPTVLGNLTNFTATLSSPLLTARPSGVVPYAYTWNFGDGTPAGTGATPSHTYGAVGYYTAIVTATSPGLTLTATTPVTIVDQALQNLTAINDSPTTLSNLTSFTATVASGSNVVYSWNFGDGATGAGQYPVHTYGAVGFYTAVVTATNSVSTLTTTTRVTITDRPILNLTAINDSPIVLGNTTHLTATANGSNIAYTWAFGDGATGAGQSPSHIYGAVGFYTAVVTATNSVSTLTTTTRVTITNQPIVNLTAINDSPTVLGNTTHLTATANGSNIVYTWAFGDGGIGVGPTPARIYGAAGVYTAVVTATNSVNTIVATTRVTITNQTQHYSMYLPLLMKTYFTAPDLIVQSVAASSDVITVVIKNIGDAPAAESFWVDAYVDPNPPPTAVNQIWWDQGRSKQGVAWAVVDPIVPILPGQVITLTSRDPNVSPERTLFLGNLPVGTPIYAQVDSYNYQTNYGAVLERHEILGLPYNNILGPVYSTAGSTHLANVITRPPATQLDRTLPARSMQP